MYFRKSSNFDGNDDDNADPKTRARDWTLRACREGRRESNDKGEGDTRNLKECSCLMMFKKGL